MIVILYKSLLKLIYHCRLFIDSDEEYRPDDDEASSEEEIATLDFFPSVHDQGMH